MVILTKPTAALCAFTLALAVAVLPAHVDAHAFLLLPKPAFTTSKKDYFAYTIAGEKLPPADAYDSEDFEDNARAFTANYNKGNFKNLREFIFKNQQPSGPYEEGRPEGGTAECGFSIPTAKPQPLPSMLEYGNYELDNTDGLHAGPCEAWCDDEIVLPLTPDCRTLFNKPIPYAKDKCVGKKLLTFFWLATDDPPFQVYTNCVPLQGAVAGEATSAPTTATPKPTTATNVAPKATATAKPPTTDSPKPATATPSASATAAPKPASTANNTTTKAPVKCKVR